MRGRRLRWALAGIVVAAVLVAAVAVPLWPHDDPITVPNYHRIRERMTPAEVHSILGPPQRETSLVVPFGPRRGQTGGRSEHWQGDAAVIDVCYDDLGRVVFATINVGLRPGLFERLGTWLKDQRQRWLP